MNRERIPNQEDFDALGAMQTLSPEERSLQAKELAGLLVAACTPLELLNSAERAGHLYTKAASRRLLGSGVSFGYSEVDVYASAVLMALEEHPDRATALSSAASLRHCRAASRNEPSSAPSPLDSVGLNTL